MGLGPRQGSTEAMKQVCLWHVNKREKEPYAYKHNAKHILHFTFNRYTKVQQQQIQCIMIQSLSSEAQRHSQMPKQTMHRLDAVPRQVNAQPKQNIHNCAISNLKNSSHQTSHSLTEPHNLINSQRVRGFNDKQELNTHSKD